MHDEVRVRPPRPHTGVTKDGRRLAEVLTYTMRGSKLSGRRAEAWARCADRWWIPDEAVDSPDFDLTRYFDRAAPLIVEIGSGIGEATAALAATRPECNVLALEVWRPGVADTFLALERTGARNVRLLTVDAVWSVEQLFAPGSITELWTFFPDPWPKQKHQRRRLLNRAFARVAAQRLLPGGLWRLATDWREYAGEIASILGAEPLLENVYDGPAPRWDDRPLTRFERRGIRAGHPIVDLAFRRR